MKAEAELYQSLHGLSVRTVMTLGSAPDEALSVVPWKGVGDKWAGRIILGERCLVSTDHVFATEGDAIARMDTIIEDARLWLKQPPPPPSALTEFEAEVMAFADERFGHRTLGGRIRKLGEEFGELAEAVIALQQGTGSVDAIAAEAADCNLVLTDLLALLKRSLAAASKAKLAHNKTRKVKP